MVQNPCLWAWLQCAFNMCRWLHRMRPLGRELEVQRPDVPGFDRILRCGAILGSFVVHAAKVYEALAAAKPLCASKPPLSDPARASAQPFLVTGIIMPVLASIYIAPWFVRNGHANTMWPVLFREKPQMSPSVRRVRLETPDGDFLDVDQHPSLGKDRAERPFGAGQGHSCYFAWAGGQQPPQVCSGHGQCPAGRRL